MSVNAQIEEICIKSKVSDYLTNRGVEVIKRGKHLLCRCPLHEERTASFCITTKDNGIEIFKCFGCGKSGNIISIIRYLENEKNGHIINRLARSLGMTLSPYAPTKGMQIEPHPDEILKTFCDEDAVLQVMYEYALALMESRRNSPQELKDLIFKVSRIYKMMDELLATGDIEAIGTMFKKLKRLTMEYNK